MPPIADLTVLGTVRLEGTGNAGTPLQARRLALLTYLAVARPRGAHRRDSLVALLWPELDQQGARSALRQALHALRRVLGSDAITSDGTELVALVPARVRCDVWSLEDAAERGDHAAVLRAWSGELLNGLHVTEAPGFERWVDGERARLRDAVRRSAWAEAERAHARGAVDDLERHVRLAVSLADLDEDAVRRAMALLGGVGQRASALGLYESFAATLRHELDVDPSPETRSVADDLRRDRALVSPSAVARGRTPPVATESSHVTGVRTASERRSGRAIAAAALLVLTAGASSLFGGARGNAFDPRTVLLEPFVGPDSLDTRATEIVRAGLAQLGNIRVAASPDARRAGTIVRGSIRYVGDSVEFRAEVVDRATDAIARVAVARAPRGATTAAAAGVFSDRLNAAIATALYPGWGTALSQPLTYESYALFVEGMMSIKRELHNDAVRSFAAAFAVDSSFASAGLLEAMTYYKLGKFVSADSLARVIGRRRATLRQIDVYLLDWLQRMLEGDRVAARTAMEAITRIAPTAELAWLQLAIDYLETGRPAEAIAALRRIDPASDFGEGWAAYWATQLEALHLMRDHQRELALAREALRRHPGLVVLAHYELRALAALGRAQELEPLLAQLDAMPASRGMNPPSAMRQVALELAAHGNHTAARAVLARTRAWYERRPAAEQTTLAWRAGYARTLYLSDVRAASRALYDSLRRELPPCLDCVAVIGVLDARSGDTALARRADSVLSAANQPFLFARNIVWRARIAAAFGDTASASTLLGAAFASGAEFDVMSHADFDLARIRPDDVYRRIARLSDHR